MGIDALSAGGSRCRTHAAAAVLGVGSLPAPPRSLPPQRSCARSSCKLQCLELPPCRLAHGGQVTVAPHSSQPRSSPANHSSAPSFPQPPPLRRLQIARPPISSLQPASHKCRVSRYIRPWGKMHVSQLTVQLVRMYPGLTSHSLALAQSLQLLCVLLHAAEAAARAVS